MINMIVVRKIVPTKAYYNYANLDAFWHFWQLWFIVKHGS